VSYVEEMFSLEGVCAVVTGGAGVLPSAMSRVLLRAGARVSVWGRGTHHPVSDAVAKLEADTGASGRVFGQTVDTAHEAEVAEALARTESEMGLPNLLVNGVGGNKGKSEFVEIDTKTFGEVVEMNLLGGLVIPSKVFAKRWQQTGTKASIINLASMTSFVPLSGVWAYNAAKSAVKNLTEGAARELAPLIRVNAIAPGFFIGYQNKALLIKNEETGELTDRGRSIIDRTPFGRFGAMDDIEGATVFLASEKASGFVTGITLPVDGGYLTDNI
jgi:NAD(P)-dependent dehydrogenase (short-subunit alcohol dehydrogenase family)